MTARRIKGPVYGYRMNANLFAKELAAVYREAGYKVDAPIRSEHRTPGSWTIRVIKKGSSNDLGIVTVFPDLEISFGSRWDYYDAADCDELKSVIVSFAR